MGQLKFERLTLMAEECKAAEESERQANRTKRLADNVTNVDENEDDEENEEGEEEEEEDEDDDGSKDEACAGIPRENSDEEEDEWTNEPRHLKPGSVREYDRRAYARVSPTTQPRGEGERSTKLSSEGSANLPVLG
ncbi:hypothetical protein ABEW05_004507 [Botrytis cinerea]